VSLSAGEGNKAATGARTGKDQPLVQPLGKVPINRKEEAESIVLGVMIFGFFMTGGFDAELSPCAAITAADSVWAASTECTA